MTEGERGKEGLWALLKRGEKYFGGIIVRERYKTVKAEAKAEIVEKKSRFIANVKRVSTEQDAIDFYELIKKKFWDARHNVYAYYIGGDIPVQKFSDEGEPTGTAGMPILETIKRQGLEDVVVVVTRYFGGILLGTGGLIRAYSKSAGEGIKLAGVVERIWATKVNIKIDYALLGKIQSIAISEGWQIIDSVYSDLIDIYMAVPVEQVKLLRKKIAELTAGTLEITEADHDYYITEEI